MAILEVCVERASDALEAERGGAARIELCADLAADGLTPSEALLREVVERCSIPVFAMIRPQPGGFTCDAATVRRMEAEVEAALELGASGVVLGVLDDNGEVDGASVERVVRCAGGRPVTFHRAFDRVRDPLAALDQLADLGISRILTSGQAATALEGADLLARLVERAGERLVVLAGGGVRAHNVRELRGRAGVVELHSAVAAPGQVTAAAVRELLDQLED